MEVKRLFKTRGASFCSENAFRLTKLSDCRSNIDDQLKRWHLSQHIGFVQERELILNRSGLPIARNRGHFAPVFIGQRSMLYCSGIKTKWRRGLRRLVKGETSSIQNTE